MKRRPGGFALITAALVLLVVGIAAFVLISEGGMGQRLLTNDAERAELEYVTEAGLAHARWLLAQNASCENYAALPGTGLGQHSYDAVFAPGAGSPLTAAVTGQLANGVTQTTSFPGLRAYDAPQTVVLQLGATAGKDTLIDGFYKNANYGDLGELIVRSLAVWRQRPLLEFDMSGIPANAHVISAKLELQQRSVITPGVVSVHRITRSWQEGTGRGTGNADGATWNEYDGISPWAQPGGEFGPTLYATATITSADNGQFVPLDVRGLVAAWVSGQYPNFGLILIGDGVLDGAAFASRQDADPANAPKLTITYACECGVGCVGGILNEALVLSTHSTATLGGLSFTELDLAEYDRVTDTATLFFDGALTTLDKRIDAVHVLANGHIVLSPDGDTFLGGLNVEDGDLVDYDPVADSATLLFDGSARFADPGDKVESVHVLDNGHLVLSTDGDADLGGLSFTKMDLVDYDPTSDTATLFFDGSLTTLDKKIDAVHVQANGHIALSADGETTLGGLTFDDEDVIEYDPVTDTATLLFDGDLRFAEAGEKVISVHVGPGSGSVTGGTPPVAHWRLDDGAGPTAVDSVGGHDGTLTNGPVWAAGQLGGALEFDGANDYVDAGTFDVVGSGLTLTGWFNADAIPTSDPRIVSKADGTNASDAWWQLSTTDSGSARYLRMRVKAGGTTTTFADSTVNLAPGRWYFAVGTYDNASGEMKLYLDGTEVASGTHAIGGPVDVDPSVPVAIGANGTAERFFDGLLDDVRVYAQALGAVEIAELYAQGVGGPVAHWKLNDGAGPTAVDSAGGHDGTLIDGPVWAAGPLGGALDFDGAGDRVDASSVLDAGSPAISVTAWVNKRDTGDDRVVCKSSGTAIVDHVFSLGLYGTTIRVRLRTTDNGGTSNYDAGSIVLDQWAHLAFSYDGSALRIYQDGVETASHAVTGDMIASALPTVLGNVNTTDDRYLNGMLDDVRIYDRALSAGEVAGLYASGSGGGGGGGPGAGTFRDEFLTNGSYAGSDGTLPWATDWLEINESNGASMGDEQVRTGPGGFVARVQDNDGGGEGLQREADLSGYATATLTFIYWRGGLDNANDYVTVDVSDNGGSTWTELDRFEGPASDPQASPQSASYDISAYIAPNTRIRFLTSPNLGGTDRVYLDNVQIEVN